MVSLSLRGIFSQVDIHRYIFGDFTVQHILLLNSAKLFSIFQLSYTIFAILVLFAENMSPFFY